MQTPENTNLYRMVHYQNVEYILENGMCCREHERADPDYINIGHRQLISDRHEHLIPIRHAGSLGEYVPFYFAGHSPMLYLIKNGYQGVTQVPQNDIVFLVCKMDRIIDEGLEYVFSDRNAKISIANFYTDPVDLEQLNWDCIKAKDWRNDADNLARRDLKQAEFLIRNFVPVGCIYCLVVKTDERKAYFEEIITKLGLDMSVYVDTSCKLFY